MIIFTTLKYTLFRMRLAQFPDTISHPTPTVNWPNSKWSASNRSTPFSWCLLHRANLWRGPCTCSGSRRHSADVAIIRVSSTGPDHSVIYFLSVASIDPTLILDGSTKCRSSSAAPNLAVSIFKIDPFLTRPYSVHNDKQIEWWTRKRRTMSWSNSQMPLAYGHRDAPLLLTHWAGHHLLCVFWAYLIVYVGRYNVLIIITHYSSVAHYREVPYSDNKWLEIQYMENV